MCSDWLVFCDCGFQSVCSLMEKDKRLMEGQRSQDGGGIGRGDHFLFYKFIERTTEQ